MRYCAGPQISCWRRRGVIVLGFVGACGFLVPVLFTHDLMTATICLALSFFFAELIVAPIWAAPIGHGRRPSPAPPAA